MVEEINAYIASLPDYTGITVEQLERIIQDVYGLPIDVLGEEIKVTVNFQASSAAAAAFDKIAGAGFTLFIPILGGFIANSIAGRQAMAPAMMLSIIVTASADMTMFN